MNKKIGEKGLKITLQRKPSIIVML